MFAVYIRRRSPIYGRFIMALIRHRQELAEAVPSRFDWAFPARGWWSHLDNLFRDGQGRQDGAWWSGKPLDVFAVSPLIPWGSMTW